MINFKTFENNMNKDEVMTIVGVPSGECIYVNLENYNKLIEKELIFYNLLYKTFIFDDSDYKQISNLLGLDKKNKFEMIESFLNDINLKKYKIYIDGTVDVFESVNIKIKMKYLPVKFEYIMGDFDISHCDLITLDGCPLTVDGNFNCSYNRLIDLKSGPWEVGGNYDASLNNLNNLVGSPLIIRGDFIVSFNSLKSLINGPMEVIGSYYVDNCLLNNLTGCPDILEKFDCSFNFLKDLSKGPKRVHKYYDCSNNELISLVGAPLEANRFLCNNNKKLNLNEKSVINEINRMKEMGIKVIT